jgi:hypothetical protein
MKGWRITRYSQNTANGGLFNLRLLATGEIVDKTTGEVAGYIKSKHDLDNALHMKGFERNDFIKKHLY